MRTAILAAGLLAALALAGSAWLLLGSEQESSGASGAAPVPRVGAPDAQREFLPAPADSPAPSPLAGERQLVQQPEAPQTEPAPAPAPTLSLSGRVLRKSDGTPWAGVRVGHEWVQDSDSPGSTTDDEGRFVLAAVPADAMELIVSRTDGWPPSPQHFPLAALVQAGQDLTLICDSGFSVVGRVLNDLGQPLDGADVDANGLTFTQADGAGRFQLRDVAPAPAEHSVRVSARAPWHQQAGRDLLVPRAPENRVEVELSLKGSGAVQGVVTDGRGWALPEARVRLTWRQDTAWGGEAPTHLTSTTDIRGQYRLDHVPPGIWVLQAEPPEGEDALVSRSVPGVEVQLAQVTSLDVTLSVGARITGVVRDGAGSLLPDAQVLLQGLLRWKAEADGFGVSSGDDWEHTVSYADGGAESQVTRTEHSTHTGPQGSYVFEGLPSGLRAISVSDPSGRAAPQRQELWVQDGQEHTGIDFLLASAVTVVGRVTDLAGDPIAGALVLLRPAGTRVYRLEDGFQTDESGRFQILGLAQEPHSLQISAEGYADYGEGLDELPSRIERTLLPAYSIRGSVLDARDDQPLAVVTVQTNGSTASSLWKDIPLEQGRFSMDVDDDETFTVIIRASGFETQTQEDVTPSATVGAPLVFRLWPKD